MEISDLISQVATIRTVTGEEIIARVKSVEKNGSVVVVSEPRVVLLDESGQAMILPYSLTGVNHLVVFQTRNIFSITPATRISADDYEMQIMDESA